MGEPLQSGDVVADRYSITAKLGQGGFASTFAAHDLQANQLVAVKALSLENLDDWKTVDLFRREAAVLEGLNHPRIPQYIDFIDIEADRTGFLVQTLAPGKPLSALLAEGRRFSEADCLGVALQVLDILDYLAGLRPAVVHRDIKPANLIADKDLNIQLVDFGAVRQLAGNTVGGSTMVGTLGYMAPEQLHGQATEASDVYGLAMTLVHMLTGIEPATLPKKRLKPDFAKHVDVNPAFGFVLNKMLEPVPEDRIKSPTEALRLLGDARPAQTAIVASDGIDALVNQRDAEQATSVREQQRYRLQEQAKIAKRRARLTGATEITHADGYLTLHYRPTALQRMRHGSRWVGVLIGASTFGSMAFVFVLGILQSWHLAVLINVGVWGGLFGIAGAWWAIWSLVCVMKEPLSVRVNRQGNFMAYRNEKRPLSYGRHAELDVSVRPAGDDDEFGYARIASEGFRMDFEHLSEHDVNVFQQFEELAKRAHLEHKRDARKGSKRKRIDT